MLDDLERLADAAVVTRRLGRGDAAEQRHAHLRGAEPVDELGPGQRLLRRVVLGEQPGRDEPRWTLAELDQAADVAVVRGVAGVEPRVHLGRALDRQFASG